jgi:hypothetical protein
MPSAILVYCYLVLHLTFFFSLNHLYFGLKPKFCMPFIARWLKPMAINGNHPDHCRPIYGAANDTEKIQGFSPK